jgi:hypothetical protein
MVQDHKNEENEQKYAPVTTATAGVGDRGYTNTGTPGPAETVTFFKLRCDPAGRSVCFAQGGGHGARLRPAHPRWVKVRRSSCIGGLSCACRCRRSIIGIVSGRQ